jgi:hypothetical protein
MVSGMVGGEGGDGGNGKMGIGRALDEKAVRALVKTSSKWGGVRGEYGRSLLRSSGWNPHQNAVSRSSLVRKRARVIALLRARNCS